MMIEQEYQDFILASSREFVEMAVEKMKDKEFPMLYMGFMLPMENKEEADKFAGILNSATSGIVPDELNSSIEWTRFDPESALYSYAISIHKVEDMENAQKYNKLVILSAIPVMITKIFDPEDPQNLFFSDFYHHLLYLKMGFIEDHYSTIRVELMKGSRDPEGLIEDLTKRIEYEGLHSYVHTNKKKTRLTIYIYDEMTKKLESIISRYKTIKVVK